MNFTVSAEPRIAAEHLIAAFAGNHAGIALSNLTGKQQKRCIHIRHAWKAARGDRRIQRIREIALLQKHLPVQRTERHRSQMNVRRIHLRPECIRHIIAIVARVIHRIAVHPPDALAEQRGQRRGIDAAR